MAQRGRRSCGTATTRSTPISCGDSGPPAGLPVLVNTSFNVHEEPIVNRPEECLRALNEGRVDFVVTRNAVYTRTMAPQIVEDISVAPQMTDEMAQVR